jgi:hypothetical protein
LVGAGMGVMVVTEQTLRLKRAAAESSQGSVQNALGYLDILFVE